MDLKQELTSNKVVLLTLENVNYKTGVLELLKSFSGDKVIYVVLNKSYAPVDRDFNKNGIDTQNFYYVNMARGEGKKEQSPKAYQLDSTSALTELSIVIDRLLKEGYNYLLFDSITNLLVYNNADKTKKFMIDLTNKIKNSPSSGAYYALDSQVTKDLIKNLGQFVDKTIKIEVG